MIKKTVQWPVLLFCLVATMGLAQSSNPSRDKIEQPEKVMEAAGVKPGMVVGEIGAGQGYFTFWLAKGVGAGGRVYANDIDSSALAAIERRRENEKVDNVETILGTVDEPLLPAGALDMVFIVNAFHDLARPVELLANLLPALKPGATVVIMDRDPARFSDPHRHFLTREQVEEIVGRSVFEMDRVETFLRDHNLYILKARKQA
ncbi:MAG: methyltransferase domain-containing protein [Candidatus Aminicenantes bacterium]|nr:methyltransferase domain-containing protein [Candidatus Aminicenantes bacterium]